MAGELPTVELGGRGGGREEMLRLVAAACKSFAERNTRAAADALCAAEGVARHDGLHREGAKLRKAIGILAQGGRPRLLVRGVGYFMNERGT